MPYFHIEFIKYDSDGNQTTGLEPYTLSQCSSPTKSSSTPTIPNYLEIIYDENDDNRVISGPYEIPLRGHNDEHFNDDSNVQMRPDISTMISSSLPLDSNIKERTFSSSSTVSETSLCYPYAAPPPPNTILSQNVILTVALPKTEIDCSSDVDLFTPEIHTPTDLTKDKIQQLYSMAAKIDDISNCDGITLM